MFRCRTELHRTAGRPDGLEYSRDVWVHGQIEPHGEGAREFRPSMFHRHFPRQSLWITGVDQPRSIAIEDRKQCVEHIAHHLLEVVRALDRSVNLIHALQEPEMGLAFFLGLLALDPDAREVGDLFDHILLLRCRNSRFAGVYRKSSQYPAIQGDYRCRPARSEAMWQGQVSIIGPKWILSDIGDNDWFFAVRRRSARSRGRTDGGTVDRVGIPLWKTRRCAVPKTVAIRIQQQNRT